MNSSAVQSADSHSTGKKAELRSAIQTLCHLVLTTNPLYPTPDFPSDIRIGSRESPSRSLAKRVIAQALLDLTMPVWRIRDERHRRSAAMFLLSNAPDWAALRLSWGYEAGYHPDAITRKALRRAGLAPDSFRG